MNRHHNQKFIDDRLADFTDRLLSGDSLRSGELDDSTIELEQLQRTVCRLHHAYPPCDVDPAMENRIRSRMLSEFRRNMPGIVNTSRKSWLSPRTLQWGLVVTTAVILIVILGLLPSDAPVTPGAAGTKPIWIPLIVFLGFFIGVIIWRFRKK